MSDATMTLDSSLPPAASVATIEGSEPASAIARRELAEVEAEIALLDKKIALSSDGLSIIEARRLERAPGSDQEALAETAEKIYTSIAGWRERLLVLERSRNERHARVEAVKSDDLERINAQLRKALQPFLAAEVDAHDALVGHAINLAKSIRIYNDARRERLKAFQRVAPIHGGTLREDEQALLPELPRYEEPLWPAISEMALEPSKPYWLRRAGQLGEGEG